MFGTSTAASEFLRSRLKKGHKTMPLINCPECGIPVSSLAGSCPKCAYPIAGGGSTQANAGKIQTVEQRSKRYKMQLLLSGLLCWGSIIVIAIDNQSGLKAFGGLGLLVGIIWYILIRFEIWWNHG
jgi:hypothetical protein